MRVSVLVVSVSEKDNTVSIINEYVESVSEGDITEASDNGVDKEDKDSRSNNDFSHSPLGRVVKFLGMIRGLYIIILLP